MNSELIMKTDVLDILFEKRNKAYGAYTLRKFYNTRLTRSLVLMTAFVALFSAFTLLPDKAPDPGSLNVKDAEMAHIPIKKIPDPLKPPVPVKPHKTMPASTVKLSSKIILTDKPDSAIIVQNLDNRAIGSVTNYSGSDGVINEPAIPGTGGGEVISTPAPAPARDLTKPIDNPEKMPEYPGGMEALRKFLIKNLGNPRDLETGELVSVKVKFVVGYDGKLQGFETVQDGGAVFNNEVIRVLKKMPAWIPGKSNGQNVAVYYTIPVKFVSQD